MQLHDVGGDRLDDLGQQRVVRVDEQRHDLCLAARLVGKHACCLRQDVARAAREKDEAHVVGAAGERGIERRLVAQSADFDFDAHRSRRIGQLACN